MAKWNCDRGWTLIELTIVISLITILSTIALVGYRSAVTRTREAVLKEDLFRMREAIDQYYADREAYPAGLSSLVSGGYIRSIPTDPITGSSESWSTTFTDTRTDAGFGQGLFDVRSGAQGNALDGTLYSEW